MVTKLFSFPHPVNEVSARLVAGGVLIMAVAAVMLQQRWLLVPIAYGFGARVLSGPTLSPLGQLVTRVITPMLPVPPKYVAGPPKRFAQACGATMSGAALILAFGFGQTGAALGVIAVLAVFAALESIFAFCVGCKIFGILMAMHIIPQEICADCANIGTRTNLQAYTPGHQQVSGKE